MGAVQTDNKIWLIIEVMLDIINWIKRKNFGRRIIYGKIKI